MFETIKHPPEDDRDLCSKRTIQTFLLIIFIEGVIAIPTVFNIPSMDRNAFLWGYSKSRLLLGLIFILLDIFFLMVFLLSIARPKSIHRALSLIDSKIASNPTALGGISLLLFSLSIVGAYILLLFHFSLIPTSFYTPKKAIERSIAVLIWIVSIPAQLSITLIIHHRVPLRTVLANKAEVARLIAVFLVLLSTALHGLTLIFQAQWIYHVDGWFWRYTPKHLRLANIFMPAAAILGFFLLRFLAQSRIKRSIAILLLVFYAYFLQVAFGFALGRGFESIRSKYESTPLSNEMLLVCESESDTLPALRNYESIYGSKYGSKAWYGTKPPGLFAFYSLTRDILRAISPNSVTDAGTCFHKLSMIFAIIMPLLSALVIVPVSAIEKTFLGPSSTISASLLYMSAPSVLLMTLIPDQFLYPLLFTTSIYLLVMATIKKSLLFGLLAGAGMCISLYVSYSLLPIVGMALAWIALSYGSKGFRSWRNWGVSSLLGIILGFLLISWILIRYLGYAPITRYLNAMDHHRHLTGYTRSISNLLQYGLLNNLEYAFWIGFPLFTLAIIGTVRSFRSAIRNRHTIHDCFNISFFFLYFFLNFLGPTKGEVGRIWIFLLPAIAIVAAKEASTLLKDPTKSVWMVFALQFMTSIIAFYNLDFR
jgi:hypothetical protein